MAYVVRLLRVLLLALLGVSSGHLAALANATGQLRTAPGYVYDGVANTAHARLGTTASPAGATRTAASTWTSSVSGSPASVASVVAAETGGEDAQTLFHYTDEAGHKGILESEELNPSLKSVNPNDARYGNGQYLSDIEPGTKTSAQLSRAFLNNPFQGARFTLWVPRIPSMQLRRPSGTRG